jgi:hypothetical protein
MNRLAIAGLTTIVALAMTSNSFAQGGFRGPGISKPPQTTDKLAKTVGLTDEQVKKVNDVETARAAALVDVRAAMDANMQAIQDAAKNGDSDKQNAAFAQSQKLNTQYQEVSQKFDDARMAVLTDDQKAKLKEANDAETLQHLTQAYTQMYQAEAKLCGLSDDQVKSMVAIELARDAAVTQWQSENKDKVAALSKALQEATKSGDAEKIKELQAALKELQAPMMALYAKGDADTFAVMTDAQKATWLEHELVKKVDAFRDCNLTEDQKSKFKQACHTLAQEKGATCASLWPKLEQEVFNTILTDDQKINWLKIMTLQYIDMKYYVAKLTDEQKAKIKENYVKLVADKGTPVPATLKDLKSMWGAAQELFKKLSPQVDAILSNEQTAAMEKWKKFSRNAPTTL